MNPDNQYEGRSPSCPLCGSCDRSKVTNTYYQFQFADSVRQMIVKRRRVCNSCGLPFHSIEQTEPGQIPTTSSPRRELRT